MLFHTHVLIGIITFLLLHSYLPGNEYLILLFILIGSILPDIDEHKSKAAQLSGVIGKIVSFFASHRGIFHSFLLPLIGCGLLGYFWNFAYASALFIGYFVHLLADALTPMGIPILWPFKEFKLRGPIRCGTWQEWILFGMLVLLIIKEVLF
ncbi:MAG: metal-dependent hydrolase [Candidatus Woesearchaeota archaeon]|jgi:inner membrane protein